MDITRFSSVCGVRRLTEADAGAVLAVCMGNPLFYEHCGVTPSIERVLRDMRVAPPGIPTAQKHYVGLYRADELVAVLDVVDGYPREDVAFIGFFMMNAAMQGRGAGSAIVGELCDYLKETGMSAVHLVINKGNPQATHFWTKNGFVILRETEGEDGPVLYAEKPL